MRGTLIGPILFATALAAAAQAAEPSLEAQITECAASRDAAERLACFDAVAGRLQVPTPAEADEEAEEAAFGDEFLRRDDPPEPEQGPSSITSTIERLERRPRGEHVFHLGNGQVWTELEVGRVRYQAGTEVTIDRTTFGGYMLSTESGRATRVRRIE